ncbi:MAG: cobyrinate a,c-diamide synthase, partial [Deltaproteobacteria bacterium]|nr:cobyrinate a,c-diamide synthase [Deltaproteobacteria bacterium]
MDARSDHNQYGHTLVIAGTGSSVGKTSIALGMTAALVRRGVAVQPYKVGPDFLDPTYLRLAAGRECYNLDGWMCGQSYVQRLFERLAADAEINIIEGVMGLFDGADTGSLAGSTAEIASWLRAPVLLVVNAHGMGKSFAAMVKGYTEFDPSVHIAGVIANKVGSDSHTALLRDALEANALPELIGAIPRGALPKLPSRHLGLISADSTVISDSAISTLADACERFININKLSSRLSDTACPPSPSATALPQTPHVKIGVARDKAFHFCYPDNIRAFEENGAEIRYFSPLQDAGLPDDLDAVYLPGGYPEEHV